MTEQAEPWHGGYVDLHTETAHAHRTMAPTAYRRVRQLIEDHVAGSLIILNSGARDFDNEELRPYLETYLHGSHGIAAQTRVKLMKLVWDSVGSEFASRHELYERLWAAPPEAARVETYHHARESGLHDELCDSSTRAWPSTTPRAGPEPFGARRGLIREN